MVGTVRVWRAPLFIACLGSLLPAQVLVIGGGDGGALREIARYPGVEEIHAYERRLNKLLDEYPEVTVVCQYDITRFDSENVLEACCTHPIVHLDEQLRRGFFVPPQG